MRNEFRNEGLAGAGIMRGESEEQTEHPGPWLVGLVL